MHADESVRRKGHPADADLQAVFSVLKQEQILSGGAEDAGHCERSRTANDR